MKNNYFRENLKFLRNSLNISQKEIANYLKLNPSSYSNYESGRREPGIDALIKISNFLNVEIDKLLTENLGNNVEFLKDIQYKFANNIDYNKKVEDINSDMRKNILFELENKKKKYLFLINKEIPKKIKEIDNLIKYINRYNTQDVEISDEITGDFLEKYEKYLYNPIEILTTDFFGAIPCGTPIDSSYEFCDRIDIPLIYPLKENADYFVLRASGDSMDELIYDGEYLVIERNTNYNNGDIVVALVNGHNTLKEFYSTSSHLILKPRSNNPIHKEQIYQLPADIKIQGKYICKLDDLNNTYEKILEMQNSL